MISSTLLMALSLSPAAVFSENEKPAAEETLPQIAKVYPVAILGGGVGALTSALYLARAGQTPLVIEGPQPGGLLTQSHSVQNWPGEMEIEGGQLTDRIRRQTEENGAVFRSEEVIGVDFSKRPFTIVTRKVDEPEVVQKIQVESCIIAMGTQPNYLQVPGETGESGYWGKGVTNCAICDGNLYRGKIVGVVGGGDAAVLEALYLANIAKEVHIFVRKGSLRAFEEKRSNSLKSKENIKIHYNTSIQEIRGDGQKLTHVLLKGGKEFPLDGLFLAIGSTPNSKLFKGILKLDERGYILLEKDQQTSIEGVYAIGDIVDPVYKQAISAAGDGAKAALAAQQYLSDRENGLIVKKEKKKKEEPAVASQGTVIEIQTREQFEQELNSDIPVIVDFYASWCGPCKKISPLIESSAHTLNGKVKFLKVNVDKLFEISNSYEIRAMPTVLLIDPTDGVVDRKVGTDQIVHLLNQLRNQP